MRLTTNCELKLEMEVMCHFGVFAFICSTACFWMCWNVCKCEHELLLEIKWKVN